MKSLEPRFLCGETLTRQPVRLARTEDTIHGNVLVHWLEAEQGDGKDHLRADAFGHFTDLGPDPSDAFATAFCHKSLVRLVQGADASGRRSWSHGSADQVGRQEGAPVVGFRSAHTLHLKLLKHVLGLEQFSPSVGGRRERRARARLDAKRYLEAIQESTEMDTRDWKYWIRRLEQSGCPSWTLLRETGDFSAVENRRPCRCSTARLANCHAALFELGEAFQEWITRAIHAGISSVPAPSMHMHLSRAGGTEELVIWNQEGLWLPSVSADAGYVLKTAFLLNNNPRTASRRLQGRVVRELVNPAAEGLAIHHPESVGIPTALADKLERLAPESDR